MHSGDDIYASTHVKIEYKEPLANTDRRLSYSVPPKPAFEFEEDMRTASIVVDEREIPAPFIGSPENINNSMIDAAQKTEDEY